MLSLLAVGVLFEAEAMVENFISEMSAEDLLRFLRLLVVEGLSMEDSQAPDSQALFST